MPARFSLCSPLLLYTSSEHGFSLKTFYQRVGAFEPTVLLLRTAEDAVIGAYCSKHWDTRNELLEDGSRQAYFGTGEIATEEWLKRLEGRRIAEVRCTTQSAAQTVCGE